MARTINLTGWNTGGFGDLASGWFNSLWNDSNYKNNVRSVLQSQKNYGVNCIRIMSTIRWWLENTRETYQGGSEICNLTARDAILRTIEVARDLGMWVIFTFWSIDTVGPRSPSIQDVLPYPPDASSQNYETIRNSDDFVELWAGNSLTSSFLARFANVNSPATSQHVHNNGVPPPSVSEALRGYPNVIYELFNEPAPANIAGWTDVTQRIIDALRARGDQHPVMVMCGYCGSFNAWFNTMYSKLSSRSNVVYTNHIYWSDGSFGSRPQTTYADLRNELMVNPAGFGLGTVLNNNVPVIIGEFGGGSTTQYQNCLQVLNEEGIGWIVWEWRTSSSFPTSVVLAYAAGSLYGDPADPSSMALKVVGRTLQDGGTIPPMNPVLTVNSIPQGIPFTVRKVA